MIRPNSPRFDPPHVKAYEHCKLNRAELDSSSVCGCFNCLSTFAPTDISEWVDEGRTALCPECEVDSVIGSAAGFPMTPEFLLQMHEHWSLTSSRDSKTVNPDADRYRSASHAPGTARALLVCSFVLLAAAGYIVFHPKVPGLLSWSHLNRAEGRRSFEIVPLETIADTSSNASIGDLNGDGNPDIVLVKGRHWPMASLVFFGDGKGHFTPGPALPSKDAKSYSAPLADMTGSGHLDMILSNDKPDPNLILLNDGKSHFTIGGTFGDPNWPTRTAAVGDLNGDGYPDIAVANWGMPSYVCLNDGKLHFNCRALEDSPSAATVAIADINGDGANDVIYACRNSCQSYVYFNDGKGGFNRKEPWGPPNSSVRAMAVADFDGDGHPDIAACPEKLGCFVYLNDGKGHFGSGIQFQSPQASPHSMIVTDLNRDHHPDILVGYVNAPGVAYFNDGTGKRFQAVPFGDGKGTIYGMAAGDLDGDGWPDVVVARSGAPSFVMFNRPFKK
jgi:hypothetical protein